MSTSDGADWDRRRRKVFGDPYLVWHDGPDFTVLLRSTRVEPAEVAAVLGAGVAAGDPLAAESISALAAAGLAPAGSRELLRGAVPGAAGGFLVCVAQALYALTGDPSWAEPIASVLAVTEAWGVRIDAAMALAGFPAAPGLGEVLAQAVCDPEYLVRYHAANTLLRYAGRPGDVAGQPELFARITAGSAGGSGGLAGGGRRAVRRPSSIRSGRRRVNVRGIPARRSASWPRPTGRGPAISRRGFLIDHDAA